MQTYLDLTKGLHTDFEPINQPAKTYRYLLNGIRQLSGSIENELGNQLVYEFNDLSKRVIGSTVLDTDTILCIAGDNSSEIGVLDYQNKYTTITTNAALNFKLGSIIKMEAKKNYKGERIIYLVEKYGSNPMRSINIDDKILLASATFEDDIKLQINPDSPTIAIDSVVDGGSLPTGIYQATARLLTASTNATPFGLVSSIVPIINDSSSLPIDQQDGAIPQSTSPKAINFIINNIDTSYSFIEIAIITYTGTANVKEASIVARLPIDNRGSILFTYSSTSQNKESIDLEAITIKPINYDKAETIAQKDGILTLGNLTSSIDDFDFQFIANKVKLRYKIEEVAYVPGYKDPLLTATKKGYQRDEVYSFSITPEFIGQYNTTTYHIPADGNSTVASTIDKTLGTYFSSEQYPITGNYPITLNRYVRHHRMPTIEQEPLVVIRNNQAFIRLLAIEVDFTDCISLLPDSIKKKLKGFSICRQIRSENNKSIIAQGIASPHVKQSSSPYVFLSPFPKVVYNKTSFMNDTTNILDYIGFMSPETTIYNELPIGNLLLKTVTELTGKQTIAHDLRTHKNDNNEIANTEVFLDYTSTTALTSKPADIVITSNSAQYVSSSSGDISGPSISNILINGVNATVNNYKNNGYLFLKLGTSLPIKQDTYTPSSSNGFTSTQPEFFYYYRGSSSTDLIFMNGVEKSDNTVERSGSTSRYLYNITRLLNNQYGSIYDASYIYCGSYKLSDNLTTTIYGGDIFINKFGVVNQMAFAGGEDELQFRVLSYFFCESGINTAYRHYNNPVGNESTNGYVPGTTPYYPKLNILYNDPKDQSSTPGILNLSWALGHGRGYNKQYSFENNIVIYYPKQLAEDKVSKYANRVIYSQQTIEGEQSDSYRIFLPNNYHDIPKDKGEITELFVHTDKFYIHTSGALYLSSFNDRVTQATSTGDEYLGNGGVFSRPSQPILTLSGSYAGTTSSCGINTPFGRLFIDNLNSKVYLLTDKLEEISEQGMFKFFADSITNSADKPSLNSGYITSYDLMNFRILLTKLGDGGYTLSYSPQLNSWSSFHSYIPYHYITINQRLYSLLDNQLWEHNKGTYGVYYNNIPSAMQLNIVLNDAPTVTKTFDNLVFHTTSQSSQDIEQHYDTFSTLQCYNTTRNTGLCRLVVPRNFTEDFQSLGLYECFAKIKSNEFRVAIPNDLVIDVNQSIFANSNLANSRAYRPSISGKWLIVSLAYNNLRNNRFVLHTIGRIFNQRIR